MKLQAKVRLLAADAAPTPEMVKVIKAIGMNPKDFVSRGGAKSGNTYYNSPPDADNDKCDAFVELIKKKMAKFPKRSSDFRSVWVVESYTVTLWDNEARLDSKRGVGFWIANQPKAKK